MTQGDAYDDEAKTLSALHTIVSSLICGYPIYLEDDSHYQFGPVELMQMWLQIQLERGKPKPEDSF